MATRIVDVGGFELVTSHAAAADLRASASVAAAGARTQFASAALSAGASVAAGAAVPLLAAATRTATATLTAAASVTSPTNISNLMTASLDGGAYSVGGLTLPGWDTEYVVTATASHPDSTSPGIAVRFPVPSTPDVAHTVTVHYNVTGRTRRFAHQQIADDITTFVYDDGLVVECASTVGSSAALTYTWDPATQTVSVSDYSGDTLIRDHGPVDYSTLIPLTFSPETRTSTAYYEQQLAYALEVLEPIPLAMRTLLAGDPTFLGLDIISADGQLEESMFARDYLDPAWGGDIKGLTVSQRGMVAVLGVAYSGTPSHELGHVADFRWLTLSGYDHNISDYYTVVDYGTVELLYRPNATEPSVNVYKDWSTGDPYHVSTFDPVMAGPTLHDEIEIQQLFDALTAHATYYTGTITEWIAENFNWYWAFGTTYTTSATVANRTNLTNYMRLIGAWDGEVGASSAPSPVTSLAAVSDYGGAVRLTWTPPTSTGYSRPVVRRAAGTTPPSSPTDGVSVPILFDAGAVAVEDYTWDVGLDASTTYSYAVFARNFAGEHSTAATVTVTTAAPDTTAPGQVTGLTGTPATDGPSSAKVTLSWTNPADSDFRYLTIRYAVGATAPATTADGTSIADGVAGTDYTSQLVPGLARNTTYSFSVFAGDIAGNYSAATSVTVTTPA